MIFFFFDPPFKDKKFVENLENIKKRKIFNKKHVVIIHRENKTEERLDLYLNTILIREYGRSKIIFGNFN